MIRLLLLDCNLDNDSWGAPHIRTWLAKLSPNTQVDTRRPPHGDLPTSTAQYDGLVLSGSRARLTDKDPWILRYREFLRKEIESDTPLFGICFGFQLLAQELGGQEIAGKAAQHEVGWFTVDASHPQPHLINSGLPKHFWVSQNHFDAVYTPPPETVPLFASTRCPVQGFQHLEKPLAGVQFHPEHRFGQEGGRSQKGLFIEPSEKEKQKILASHSKTMEALLLNVVEKLFLGKRSH